MDSAFVVGRPRVIQGRRQSSAEPPQRRPSKKTVPQPKPLFVAHDVEAVVKKAWATSGYAVLRTLKCQFQEGVLRLHGCVCSFYYKQLAQESVRAIAGVERIVNMVEVDD